MLYGVLAAGLAVPLLLWQAHPAWAKGLGLGQVLGLLSALWIRLSVRQALASACGAKAWLWHGAGRLLVIGLALWLAIRFLAFNVWALVIGYSWMLWLTALGRLFPGILPKRGVQ